MNYTNDGCRTVFTEGQTNYMNGVVTIRQVLGEDVINITMSRTINNSDSWKLLDGNYYFTTGTSITVNGTLNAIGTSSNRITFNRNGTSGTWGGIIFNQGSFGNIQYSNISNAAYGVKRSGGNLQIQNCAISGCTYGIYATNYCGGTVTGNQIISNNTGFYLYNSSPSISYNNILILMS